MNARHLCLIACLVASPAFAQDLAGGDAIRAAISGNTVQGSMAASGAYTEFYGPEGTIKGADYTGTWSVAGDRMCFAYGADPATCWGVRIAGNQLTWVSDAGDEGTGTIQPGNPNGW